MEMWLWLHLSSSIIYTVTHSTCGHCVKSNRLQCYTPILKCWYLIVLNMSTHSLPTINSCGASCFFLGFHCVPSLVSSHLFPVKLFVHVAKVNQIKKEYDSWGHGSNRRERGMCHSIQPRAAFLEVELIWCALSSPLMHLIVSSVWQAAILSPNFLRSVYEYNPA